MTLPKRVELNPERIAEIKPLHAFAENHLTTAKTIDEVILHATEKLLDMINDIDDPKKLASIIYTLHKHTAQDFQTLAESSRADPKQPGNVPFNVLINQSLAQPTESQITSLDSPQMIQTVDQLLQALLIIQQTDKKLSHDPDSKA